MPIVLGLNAYHPDSAAALLVDGKLAAAIEEERLNRVKHCAGFPTLASKRVLDIASVAPDEIEHVAIGRDPTANIAEKLAFANARPQLSGAVVNRAGNASKVMSVPATLQAALGEEGKPGFKFHHVEHHRAHIASAFFCSPFDEAACLSIDGQGDFASTMLAVGRNNSIDVLDRLLFPHSMGIVYQAATQFLGFPKYGEEWKVMGLAPYGKPTYLEKFRDVVHPVKGGTFALNLDYFLHDKERIEFTWENGSPTVGRLWSPKWEQQFGPTRKGDDDFYGKWADIAHSLQALYEEIFFHVLDELHARTGLTKLCLAGGCALNSVANGKIVERTKFKEVYVQAAAGDDGTAIGAALYVQHAVLNQPRTFVMQHAYTGPAYSDKDIGAFLESARSQNPSAFAGISIEKLTEAGVCEKTAAHVSEGKVVGWFQGAMEYGPRALGNRSIVADPRRPNMKDILNERVKRRETYRPFAPSILAERVADVYERSEPSPFMLMVYKTKPEWRAKIPAVNHADDTGRLQSVERSVNPRYHALISAFEKKTGVPLVLNTSFNENEPVVCTPEEALNCFLRTDMDVLALGTFLLERRRT